MNNARNEEKFEAAKKDAGGDEKLSLLGLIIIIY